MKNPLLVSALSLLVVGCGSSISAGPADLMENPLYAVYYYRDLTEHMVDYTVQKDPIMNDSAKKAIVDATRSMADAKTKEISQTVLDGKRGVFQSDTDYARGSLLLLKNTLYLGPDLNVTPGPSLHVYISTVVDPRDGSGSTAFPDKTAIDLGPLKTPYFAQSYVLPAGTNEEPLRSVALWDTKLNRLFGFAQLGK